MVSLSQAVINLQAISLVQAPLQTTIKPAIYLVVLIHLLPLRPLVRLRDSRPAPAPHNHHCLALVQILDNLLRSLVAYRRPVEILLEGLVITVITRTLLVDLRHQTSRLMARDKLKTLTCLEGGQTVVVVASLGIQRLLRLRPVKLEAQRPQQVSRTVAGPLETYRQPQRDHLPLEVLIPPLLDRASALSLKRKLLTYLVLPPLHKPLHRQPTQLL